MSGSITSASIASNAITVDRLACESITSSKLVTPTKYPWNNPHNVYETINGYEVEIPLPGISPDEVKVFYEDFKLRVVTTPKEDRVDRNRKIVTVGFFKETVDYEIRLPGCEYVDAEMKNGVLYVTADKKQKGVEVAIRTA